jgi:thiamine biosynthesis lipoprotein
MRNKRPVTRRLALTVFAGASTAAVLGLSRGQAKMPTLEWRGLALGGTAHIVIRHRDEAVARKVVGFCVGEIERLERTFSLYRSDSEILHLNREGRLDDPSHDFRLLLGEAQRYGKLSGGAFDVTVQPLWRLYSGHFAARPETSEGPDPKEIERVRTLVDYHGIDLDNGRAMLARQGMEITLNGMAQGYITDRIADMLRDAGMTNVLVDIGEIRALDGGTWKIGVADPRQPGQLMRDLSITGGAVATSAGMGSKFDRAGRFHHLFDPATGHSADRCLSATAIAPTAMEADTLATALAVSPSWQANSLVHAFRGRQAILVMADGSIVEAGA